MIGPFIYAIPKDPHWMFAWWNLEACFATPETGAPLITLRVHDVTDILFDGTNSHFWFDKPVGGKARGDWYIDVPYAKRVYLIEAGVGNGGDFEPLCRSNAAFFPPDSPCSEIATHWTSIDV